MLDRLHGEINVEIGPTQMVWTRKLDVGDFHRGTECDRRTHRSSLIQYGPGNVGNLKREGTSGATN